MTAFLTLEVPLRLGRGGNDRKHWRAADRQKRTEKDAIGWVLAGKTRPTLPCTVMLTRIAPSARLDDDNLVAACKYVRDSVAAWLDVDDGDASVRYAYRQARGPWGVRIEFNGAAA